MVEEAVEIKTNGEKLIKSLHLINKVSIHVNRFLYIDHTPVIEVTDLSHCK